MRIDPLRRQPFVGRLWCRAVRRLGLVMLVAAPQLVMAGDAAATSPSDRIFGLSKIWMEVRINFPFDERLGEWDAEYLRRIDRVSKSPDLRSYYRELEEFVATLQDGHTFVRLPAGMPVTRSRPPLGVRRIGNQAVVSWVRSDLQSQIPLGSIVTHVDDQPFLVAAIRAQSSVSAGTQETRLDGGFDRAMEGESGSMAALIVQKQTGERSEVAVIRGGPWPNGTQAVELPTRSSNDFASFDDGQIAYLALRSFGDATLVGRVREHLAVLQSAKWIIADLRGNDGGADSIAFGVLSHFLDHAVPAPHSERRVYDPAVRVADDAAGGAGDRGHISGGRSHADPNTVIEPVAAHLRAKANLCLLIDADTKSAAEDFIAAAMPLRPLLVGQRTAGSTGQPIRVPLPGGGTAFVLSKRDRLIDGREFVGTGFAPDVAVEETVDDLVAARDVVLERALAAIRARR